MTDDLTTDLSRILDSFVIARNTAFTYKNKPIDIKEIGRELGVRYALEGSVRRIGEKVTVNAQLISTATGAHIWADRFEGDRTQLGELQSEFVARIANALGAELTKAESARAMLEHLDSPDALDLAMRARQAALSGANAQAIDEYEQALKLDPNAGNWRRSRPGSWRRRTLRAAGLALDEARPRRERLNSELKIPLLLTFCFTVHSFRHHLK
jgi:hypothetical protein